MSVLTAWREKCIITCALTGSATFPSQTPYLPITPDQISDEAKKACDAGAAVVHVHVRDPKTGMPTADLGVWRETLTKIKSKTDVVVCCTTGGGAGMTPEQRISVVPEFKPEMCSFNVESMNFAVFPIAERIKEWKYPWEKPVVEMSKGLIFQNSFKDLEVFAKTMYENNVKPELEIYSTSGIWNAGAMLRFGWLKFPLHMQFVLGVLGGTGNTPWELIHFYDEAARLFGAQNFTWSVIGIGYPREFHLGAMSAIMGGHIRVGLEDNIYIGHRELAKSNAELVAKMVRIVNELGRDVASPDEARKMLGLKGLNKVNY
ncbi:MAG: 3-keto-5-aminohexanoate cleavage protein [Candidatus Freyarchaeota archaeon]|nr:3-keto-5-aminohexanoate cleavage protein [Candidatus Jordarchaeia archaeon]